MGGESHVVRGGIPAGGLAAFQAGFGADASPERLLPMASPSPSAFESHHSIASKKEPFRLLFLTQGVGFEDSPLRKIK